MRKYFIKIDAALKGEIEFMAVKYLGVRDCDQLAKDVRALLAERFPKFTIHVGHVVHEPDLFVPQIRLLVIVDGDMDQGLIITKAKPLPANDYVEVAAPVGIAA